MKSYHNIRSSRRSVKNIQIIQGGQDLTAQAGLIPVVKFLKKHGFASKIEQTLDHQRGATGVYDAVDMILLPLVAIIGGARSVSSIVTVWNDRVLCLAAGWLRIPDETTFGRILRTFTQKNINEMETLNHRIRASIWRSALRFGSSVVGVLPRIVIDVDSTVKTVYGNQQGVSVGYNPHKCGAASYHPLLAFCAETKEILQGWLRSGDVYTGNGVVEFMRQLLAHLPNRTRILFRGDSGFFAEKLLDYLDDRDQDYLIKAKFKGLRLLLETKQWTRIKANHDWESTEFTHQCGTWSRSRKFVAVRREKEIDAKDADTLFEMKEYDYFCYVLTDELAPWQAHKHYGQRATSETWIEEAKNQSALAHIKTADFWANSALFQTAILAYNTLRWMVLCSGNKILRRWEAATIRTFLIRMAGKWTTGSRQQKLRVPKRMLYNAQWEAWVAVAET